MDVAKALRELYTERKLLDAAIASLEAKQDAAAVRAGNRRGRKSMSPEERREVSRRMSEYWAARRGSAATATS